ncbi:hypothetical protein CEXT_592611 [Caerostris extrusa]|uniref:Uncharacterized protein n=1 Tax=Caerostris extrusa TaxID=172846 RepID=A0AAV4Y7R6_CAEEX|nr:hypothetical protein CEXT_592611 [Caerostris extrusa]
MSLFIAWVKQKYVHFTVWRYVSKNVFSCTKWSDGGGLPRMSPEKDCQIGGLKVTWMRWGKIQCVIGRVAFIFYLIDGLLGVKAHQNCWDF